MSPLLQLSVSTDHSSVVLQQFNDRFRGGSSFSCPAQPAPDVAPDFSCDSPRKGELATPNALSFSGFRDIKATVCGSDSERGDGSGASLLKRATVA